jgi:MFS family permease
MADARGYTATVVAAASLGLVWLGDALIYVVLPLYPAVFGIDTAAIAILLSANRVIRILGYGWVSPLARRFGANTLTAAACGAAALSTLALGLTTGFVLLFIARLVWGGAYGVINLTNTAYAYGDGTKAGMHIGLNRAVSTLGPIFALGLGGWLVTRLGPQPVFVIYGLIGLLAVPLALTLPPLRYEPASPTVAAERRWKPSPLNTLFFVVALGADGTFTATLSLLLADILPVTSALIGAGLLLAAQRALTSVLALIGGPMVDRFDAQRVLVPCSLAIAVALGAIALGHVYVGSAILLFTRALFFIIAPMVAARRSEDRIGAIAAYTTWSDLGLAGGAFLGILAVGGFGYPLPYAALTIATLAATLWLVLRPAPPPPRPA